MRRGKTKEGKVWGGAALLTVVALAAAGAGCSSSTARAPSSEQVALFDDGARTALAAMSRCDFAARGLGPAADVLVGPAARGVAAAPARTCRETMTILAGLRFGEALGPRFGPPLNLALASCQAAYEARVARLARIAGGAGGDGSARSMIELRDEGDRIEGMVQQCQADLGRTARRLGLGMPDLTVASATRSARRS